MASCKYCDRQDLSGEKLEAHESWHASKGHTHRQELSEEEKSSLSKRNMTRSFFSANVKTSQGIIFTERNFLLACSYNSHNSHNPLSKLGNYFFECRSTQGGGRLLVGNDGEEAISEIIALYKQRAKAIKDLGS